MVGTYIQQSNMDDDTISVIIPVHNRASFITRCIMSILRQTYLPNEILVVDDASTDALEETVKKIAQQAGRVRITYFRLPDHMGAQAARNEGIKHAKGKWIAFLDSDDEWLPHKLEVQMNCLQARGYNERAFLYGGCIARDIMENTEEEWLFSRVVEGDRPLAQSLMAPLAMFQSMLVSRRMMNEIGGLDINVPAYQEWDTTISLARRCCFVCMNEPLFIYHIHPTPFRVPERDIEGYQYVIEKNKDDILRFCGESVWFRHIERQIVKCISYQLISKAKELLDSLPGKQASYRVLLLDMIYKLGKPAQGKIQQILALDENDGIYSSLDEYLEALHAVKSPMETIVEGYERHDALYKSSISLIMFGAGYGLAKCIAILGCAPIKYIVDNDENKQGKDYEGIPIRSPRQLTSEDKSKVHIVVAASKGWEDIRRQLEAMGFHEGKEFVSLKQFKFELLRMNMDGVTDGQCIRLG